MSTPNPRVPDIGLNSSFRCRSAGSLLRQRVSIPTRILLSLSPLAPKAFANSTGNFYNVRRAPTSAAHSARK